ncbi:MAG: hypothetical protein WEA09_06675 [Gemmatimonadota bacterium]
MSRYILGMALAVTLTACGGVAESREDLDSEAVAQEVEGTADRTRAVPPVQPAASPTVPPATSPTQMDSARTAVVRAIPAGTLLTFEVREDVSTSSHEAGDGFELVLLNAVNGPAGAVLIAGTEARGEVTNVHASTGPDDQSLLGVRVATVEAGGSQTALHGSVQSAEVEASTRDSGSRTAATIATGTAAGAILGQILGGDTRSTVTGAAVGTAVGIGVALTTRGGHATLPTGSRIVVRLDRDLVY